MSKKSDQPSLDTLTSLAKRRGFVFQASEIYGGLSGFWDYGPYGAQMVKNIKDLWWRSFVENVPNIYGLDSAIIQNPKLWSASGHLDTFVDPMTQCDNCKSLHRADHVTGQDTNDLKKLSSLLKDAKCPTCGSKELTDPREFMMMFKTHAGPIEDEDNEVYLRPETAGGIFAQFENVRNTARAKVPFGIAQIGKAFRNEISPRDFIFRVRELEQMEVEYFVEPEKADDEYENMKKICWDWLLNLGINKENIKWYEHREDERAHYAASSFDIQYNYSFGFKELWGIANRTDYDLKSHSKESGKELNYFDPKQDKRYTPYVIEPSVGVERLFLALLTDAYTEEEVEGEQRTVLKLDPKVAPVKVAVMPLVKNKDEIVKKSHEVFSSLKDEVVVEYDESGSIGKRYRRQDEIGTPYCVTIDFDSLDDDTVTIRHRDSMEQERVKISELKSKLTL